MLVAYLDLWMFAAAVLLLLSGFPVAFTLAGTGLLFAALGAMFGLFDVAFLRALPQRIYGIMANQVLIAVPLFVLMGVTLERSRVAEDLLDAMGRMFGRLRGGLGIAVLIVGALLAASTGIVGATVVTMGLLSLPTMLRRGYSPALASGTIAAAGTLGQIIPPSIVLVLLGDVLSSAYQEAQLAQGKYSPDTVSVGDLFAGALLPGLGLVLLYLLFQLLVAWLRPAAAPAMPEVSRASGRELLRALLAPLALILVVLGSILGGMATPTEAAAVGAIGALLLAGQRMAPRLAWPILLGWAALAGLVVLRLLFDLRVGRPVVSDAERIALSLAFAFCVLLALGVLASVIATARGGTLAEITRASARITSMVFVILIGAAVFSLVFRGLGGSETVAEFLRDMPGGPHGAMLAVMAVMFLLGFFLDFIEIIFVVVPIVAPVLLGMGLDPVWLGVMMALNLQTSFLTPPFGFALFYLRGVAPPELSTGAIYRGIGPFVLIQILALALLALFPGLATWLPEQLFG